MTMTSKERVLSAINHEEPDRVPIVIGASNTTGIKMDTYRAIKELLSIEAPDRYLYNWPELGTAFIDEETMEHLHSDVRPLLDRFPREVYEYNENRPEGTPYCSDWGTESILVEPSGWVQIKHPLSEAKNIRDIEGYPGWPDMNDPYRVSHVEEMADQLAREGQYAIMATPWLLSIFERAMGLQGMENFLLNLSVNPDFAEALLKKVANHCKTLMGNFLRVAGDKIDIIAIGDDLGTQESLLISPDMYRQIIKPIHADYISFIKKRTSAKLFFHTDGDVFDLIDDFVEIGVDILNPIQTSAGKMSNLPKLKKRYGRNLSFCGAIDTHHILPNGTPEEVRNEVKRVIETLGPGGGYMVGPVHSIMDDVPAENVLSMVQAVLDYGTYPLK